jgi:hypothetical protein
VSRQRCGSLVLPSRLCCVTAQLSLVHPVAWCRCRPKCMHI